MRGDLTLAQKLLDHLIPSLTEQRGGFALTASPARAPRPRCRLWRRI